MKLTKNFSGLFVLTAFVSIWSVSAFAALDRQVSVTGSCTRQVTTDRGTITLTADVRDDNLKSAIRKATRQYEQVVDAVKKLKLENSDIKTVEYNVGEVREWEKNKSVFKGYRARIGVSVSTSEIQRMSEVIDIATRAELHDVGQLTSYLSDEKVLKEQTLCLEEAAAHAREKAEKLATSLGAKLGPTVVISESNVTSPAPAPMRPLYAAAPSKLMAEQSPQTIEGGKQEVTAQVNVTFELK